MSGCFMMWQAADNLLVDTLEVTKAFERAGLPRESAEHLAREITSIIVHNKVTGSREGRRVFSTGGT
jgi:hypothetical protein